LAALEVMEVMEVKPYFANVGPVKGPLKHRDLPTGSIGVLESPDNHMPIGMTSCRGWDDQGRAVWTLTKFRRKAPGFSRGDIRRVCCILSSFG
jgi:hypothetical protein